MRTNLCLRSASFILCALVMFPAAAASGPVVTLSSPDDGATFSAPATIALSAAAADATQTITRVDFYSGDTLLGSSATAPYSFTWENVRAGDYTFSAVATNDLGQTGTSNLVHVSVTPGVGSRASAINVLTQRYDSARTGANLAESALTTANVNATQFGKLFSRSVDGQVYAQPLYVSGLNIGGGTHNVLIVATEHNSVYAFDADDPNAAAPLWQINLGTPVSSGDVLCGRLQPELGITATPVIDLASNTVYVVNKWKASGSFFNSLHALDLLSGTEKFGGPVVITATVSGTGDGSSGGSITFDPLRHFANAGLLLANGTVYAAFGSHCELSPNHGWIFAYDAQTLARKNVLNLTPNGSNGGVWQSGNALAADASGNIYCMSSSGSFDANTSGTSYGNSFLKLSSTLTIQSYFTPHDYAAMNANDLDVGSGGPLLLPGSTLLAGGGKTGTLYVLNQSSLGGYDPNTNHDVQELPGVGAGGENNPCTAYWNGRLYSWAGNDALKAFSFNGTTFQSSPVSQNSLLQSLPAGAISISANGTAAGSGIVWALNNQNGTGVLHAFDAQDLTRELWNSEQNSQRDTHGTFGKMCVPTVANGKVYAASFSGRIDVYGVIPPGLHISMASPSPGTVYGAPSNIPITVNTSDTSGTITKVDYFSGATLIGTATAPPFSFVWNNVPAGNYSISARATDSVNATATSGALSITVSDAGGQLPYPWQDGDEGGVAIMGSASFAHGTFTVKSSGTDIWGAQDAFHYVYQPLNGDGQITARVATLQNTNTWAKAGVMIAEVPVDDAANAFMGITPGGSSVFQRRTATGQGTVATNGPNVAAPYWVRVTRSGSTFTGYVSSDGVNWVQVGSDTFTMNTQCYIGLALCSHDNTVLNTSTFDSVSLSAGGGNAAPTVTLTAPADGATFTAPANVGLSATASDSNGTVTRVDFYNGATLLGSATSAPYSFAWNSVPAGSYTLTAVATDNSGASTTSNAVHITVSGGSGGTLPSPWAEQDVGGPSPAGSSSYASGQFTLRGSGADIWNTSDQFHFVYQPLNGDGTITARVSAIQNTDSWAKAGVMIRQSLAADSAHAFVMMTSGNGTNFHRRPAGGQTTINTNGPAFSAPYWVRLARAGNTFTASVSADGVNWTQVGSDTVSMPASVYIGLADTSHSSGVLNTSTFDSVSVQASGGNSPPAVSLTSPLDNATFTAPANITLQASASDSDGTIAHVDFYNGATLLGSDTAAPYTFAWNNVPAGNYTLTAVAFDNSNASTTSAAVHVTVGSGGGGALPAPWSDADVGSTGMAGSASYSSGTFTLNGSGADIWNSADAFNFASQPLSGDMTITARVVSEQNTDSWAKAGVMIRQSLEANAPHASVFVTPGNGTCLQYRATSDGVSSSTPGTGASAPVWLRLVRRSNTITASQSSDGTTWTTIGSATVSMSGTVYGGICVTAHNNSVRNTSTFSNVSVTTP